MDSPYPHRGLRQPGAHCRVPSSAASRGTFSPRRRFAFHAAISPGLGRCSRFIRSFSRVRRLWASTVSPTWASARSGVWPENRWSPRCVFESANRRSTVHPRWRYFSLASGCFIRCFQSLDELLVFLAAHRSSSRSTTHATGLQRTARAVRRVSLVDLDREVIPVGLLFLRPFSIRQRLPFRTPVART